MPSSGDWAIPRSSAGGVDPGHLEDGRHHVDGVHELVAQLAPRGDPVGPADDQRIGHPALVDLALPAAERRVAGDRPAPRVVVVDARARRSRRCAPAPRRSCAGTGSRPCTSFSDPMRPALRAGAVVGHDEHQGVVELARRGQRVEQAAQLVVGVREVGGERLHEPGVDALLVGAQRVPRRHPVGARRQPGAWPGAGPRACWRAKVSSRQTSQPRSKRPRYFASHSGGAWWGEWQAPVAR